MQDGILKAVEQGATVLAASKRLARVLRQSFTSNQRAQGKTVWKTPAILSWGAFLNGLWREWILGGGSPCPILLNPPQELAIWESIIRESPQGRGLLRIPETAQAAMDAWQLIHEYALPVRAGQFAVSEDCETFFGWADRFQARRDASGWLEQARLPDVIAGLLLNHKLPAPQPLYFAGFDEMTPQQKCVLDAIGPAAEVPIERSATIPACVKLRDSSDEILHAAAWARERLERNPQSSIGIIIPDIGRLRSKTTRSFNEALHPSSRVDATAKSFHISLGAPLSESPLIHAAFLILDLCHGVPAFSGVGMLLRSPWIAGAEREQSQRAQLDVKLRKLRLFELSLKMIRDRADHCPLLEFSLSNLERQIDRLPESQSPSDSSRSFSSLLSAVGWPGEKTLSSGEYQAVGAWQKLLSQFATLDLIFPRLEFGEALSRLRQQARTTAFQPEDEGAPVQIMGLFESSGLRFDHLWVMGLHDQAVPGSARLNPFLPLELQRVHRLPHSSPSRELEVASMVMRRLSESAPEVIFSYPAQEGDQELGPSPLWVGAPAAFPAIELSPLTERVWDLAYETISDSFAPPVPSDTIQIGGTWLLRDMATCPFRAWAQNRAGAKPLDEPELGIGARDRGKAVHAALELIWNDLQSHDRLCGMGPDEIREVIADHVRSALANTSGLGRRTEQRRLEKLLYDWLMIEKQRAAFVVIASEREHQITLGRLKINTRVDRLDEMEDGRRIILDYKTGEIRAGCWSGERPDEPQLPLYCMSNGQTIAASAFAQVRAGELGFRGVAEPSQLLPKLKRMEVIKGASICDQIAEWRRVLENLAEKFCAGVAAVDPKPNACDYCGVSALCRIKDANV